MGLSQLQRLEKIVLERNHQLQRYRDLLAGLPLRILKIPEGVYSSVHLFVIRLHQATADQHCQIFKALRASGIGVQLHYSPSSSALLPRIGFC